MKLGMLPGKRNNVEKLIVIIILLAICRFAFCYNR